MPDALTSERGALADGGVETVSPSAVPVPPAGRARRLLGRFSSSPVFQRVASGAFWSVFGTGVSRALALFAAVLVARLLGAVAFGEYNLVQNTAGTFQALAGFGLGTTATKFLSGKYRADPDAAGRMVALSGLVAAFVGTIATVALIVTGPWIAAQVLGAPQLGSALRIASLLLLLGSVNGAQFGVLTGLERFRLLAVVSGISAVVSIPLLVLGARMGGLNGGVIGVVASQAVATVIYGAGVGVAMRAAGIRPRYATALREWRILVGFSMPATFANLLSMPVTWVTSVVLANQPNGLRELGLFSAANQWRNAILLIATSAGAVLFPVFSHLHDSGRTRTLSRAFRTSFAGIAGICLAAAVVLAAAGPWIMRAYGSEFSSASRVLAVMVFTGALAAPLNVAGYVISGAGRMWLGFGLTFVWACVLAVLGWALRTHGAIGLSVAYFVAYLVHLLLAFGCAQLLLRRGTAVAAPGV